MTEQPNKLLNSLDWLRQEYSHIWNDEILSFGEKAGFLAAVCHPHRCYLMTLSLRDRVRVIGDALNLEYKVKRRQQGL